MVLEFDITLWLKTLYSLLLNTSLELSMGI